MQRRLLSLLSFPQQRQYSLSSEEDSLDQWLCRKSVGFICKASPCKLLMHWFRCSEINASTVYLYIEQLNREIEAHQRLSTGLVKLWMRWWHDIARKKQVLDQYNHMMQSTVQHWPIVKTNPCLDLHSVFLRTDVSDRNLLARTSSLENQNSMIIQAAYSLQGRLHQLGAVQMEQRSEIDDLFIEHQKRKQEQQELSQEQRALEQEQQELRQGQQALEQEQHALEQNLKQKQQALEQKLKQEQHTLEQKLKQEEQALEQKLDKKLKQEQQAMEQRITQLLAQAIAQTQANQSAGSGYRRPSFAIAHGMFADNTEDNSVLVSAADAQPATKSLSLAETD